MLSFCSDNHDLVLFNPTPFLATQIVSVSLKVKPWKKGALYLMCCKKGSDDRCQRMGGPRTVKPILISAQRFIKLQPVSKSWQGRLPVHGEGEVVFQRNPLP